MNREHQRPPEHALYLPSPQRKRNGWPWDANHPVSGPLDENTEKYPRMCIVTPSFNQGRHIEATIRSVLLQGYPNLQYIVIDGGSGDESVSIIRKYADHLDYWVSEPDRGQSHAINKGFFHADGEVFGWLNSDDILLPGALRKVAEMARSYPDAVAWVGGCHKVDGRGRIRNTVRPYGLEFEKLADWSYGGHFYQPSCFFSSDAFRKTGALDEDLHYVMDLDLWLRFAKLGRFIGSAEVFSAALIHGEAKTRKDRSKMFAEVVRVQFRYGLEDIAMRYLVRLLEDHRSRTKIAYRIRLRLSNAKRRIVRVCEFFRKNRSNRPRAASQECDRGPGTNE